MLLLVLLPDYVGIQGLSFLLILTPGFDVNFYLQKSLHRLQSQLAVIWFCRQDCSTLGGKLGQLATRLNPTFLSETIRNQPGKPNNTEQQTIRPTLTLTGHFMKVSGRNHSLTRRIGFGFTIEGDLCPTALALWSLCKLGWLYKSLEPHRGNLYQVILRTHAKLGSCKLDGTENTVVENVGENI